MTIDTIKDVLGRILSINKNLTEETLRNLLTASGWDIHDIEEGVKVFKDFNYTGEKQVGVLEPVAVVTEKVSIDNSISAESVKTIDVSKNLNTKQIAKIVKNIDGCNGCNTFDNEITFSDSCTSASGISICDSSSSSTGTSIFDSSS